ncbi:MAG: hypothetical protein DRI86_12795 [Bacteroidetes bacterium]|nr:MAG: hypothetical protein DRI86_12795 [Bacteroidota bacterium]
MIKVKYNFFSNIGICIILLSMFLFRNNGEAQQKYPQDYFRSPLNIPLVLAGSFGELRGGHFHSGIDIKTQGAIGKKVFATADGYISRIKVSPWGYGNALYIKHPNGYTSVYAHLNRYMDTIAQMIISKQYRTKSFAVEIFPKAGSIKVKQSQVIAYTGNSGSSGGPHLHFEIRNSAEEPINPLLFGIKIADHQYPSIRKFRIYNLFENKSTKYNEYPILQKSKIVKLKTNDTLLIRSDKFYIAVEGFDRWDAAVNKNGYYKLSYFFDDTLFFQFIADKLVFNQKRYINTYIDYSEYIKNKVRFQRSYIEKNTKLRNTKNNINNGIISLTDNNIHKLTIIAEDYNGQKSILKVVVKKGEPYKAKELSGAFFDWKHNNTYENSEMRVEIPLGAFYSNQLFWVNSKNNEYSNYSKLIEIYDIGVPLHKYYSLRIKLDTNVIVKDKSKLCILSLNTKKQLIYEGGKYKNGFIETKTRSFGNYFIGIDTIAPIIKQQNVYNNKNITRQRSIDFKITDDISGIDKYKATLDEKWILLKYDPKKNRLYYEIDKHFSAGKHKFKITVWDSRGNVASKSYNLIRN